MVDDCSLEILNSDGTALGTIFIHGLFGGPLIYDTDPNLTNLLISKDWQLWIIDSTRAFRLFKDLRDPKNLVQCDRTLLAKLRTLDANVLRKKLSPWLTNGKSMPKLPAPRRS
jgi:hypothetical protein